MRLTCTGTRELRFADGRPVRAASAVAAYDGRWLVAQDDATHAALVPDDPGDPVTALRLLPPVDGRTTFSEAEGTKHLKPDLEAACTLGADVLLLGSGSTPARTRGVLLRGDGRTAVTELAPTYAAVAAALDVAPDRLNLEGCCSPAAGVLRCWQRGLPALGVPTASVDLDLTTLLAKFAGHPGPAAVTGVRRYDLGGGLAVTDAVSLARWAGDGLVLVAAAVEDAPDAVADGPVTATALGLLRDDAVLAVEPLPLVGGRVAKVEGLAVRSWDSDRGRLVACVDADDPAAPSLLLELEVDLQRAE
ncbi:hypothetical protein [Nocardioides sp. SYSU D00038]|uniref:DUF6910 family protein n=1 Tax=Nocardioides sp. SYSU D00038 TaxID=2812554 RepID=UPI001967BA0E|nr:hypothetical protein [Nocardioides sp. SYSU D00038]